MRKFLKTRLVKGALVLVLALAMLPFAPMFMQLALASTSEDGIPTPTSTSIAIPLGGFNSGNTSTTGNLAVRTSGNAVLNGNGGVRLVASAGNQRGGVFFSEPIVQDSGFSASFQMRMGAGSAQVADGFTFVLAKYTNQVGAIGQGLGYSGIEHSVAIEFDTFDNRNGGGNGTVPHIWYGTNGTMDTSDLNRLVLFERRGGSFGGADLQDVGGSWSTAGQSGYRNARNYTVFGWIEYDANMTELQVTYSSSPTRPAHPTFILRRGNSNQNRWENNGATYVAYDNNFNPQDMLGERYHVGFTAATGGSMQDTTLLAFSAFGEHTDPDKKRTITIGDQEFEIGGGIDLPPINPADIQRPPGIDEEATFQGLFDEDGTQYYDKNGNPVHVNDLEDEQELIPRFSGTIRLRNQGVADGVLSDVMNGAQLPETLRDGGVSIPVRDGFRFLGYYDDILTDSTQYYDEDGNRQVHEEWQPFDADVLGTGPAVLYAWWARLGSGVVVDLRDGSWSRTPAGLHGSGSNYSSSGLLPGGTNINLPKPTQSGHAFTGWTMTMPSDDDDMEASLNGDVLTILGGGGTVTLTANWMSFLGSETAAIIYNVGETRVVNNDPALVAAFDSRNLVDENEHGITEADLRQSGVRLIVNVSDISKESPEFQTAISEITNMATGNFSRAALDKLTFYEIYAEKIVTQRAGGTVTTRLKSLPQPVTVRIPLPDDLKGATGYTVFHRHAASVDEDGYPVYRVADISDYGGNFNIEGDYLVLQIKNFSEFAILPNGAHIHFHCEHWTLAGDENFWGCLYCRFRFDGLDGRPTDSAHGTVVGNYEDLDVRARIVETHSPLYMLDIEWGEMKFVFSLDYIWDPENRIYDEAEKDNDWVITPDSNGFTQGNNQIKVYNRSNDGVIVSFTTTWKAEFLEGIDVEVKNENRADALPALNMQLARVPSRGADPPSIEAFLRMQGNPDVEDFLEKYEEAQGIGRDWLHAATLTVTIEPMKNLDDLTP